MKPLPGGALQTSEQRARRVQRMVGTTFSARGNWGNNEGGDISVESGRSLSTEVGWGGGRVGVSNLET